MSNPYKNLPPHHFWYQSMSDPMPGHIDPVVRRQLIGRGERIATMGSCFAQHLAKRIAQSGFRYFVPETAPDELSETEAQRRHYGTFSARYGNVYTVRQALQLFDRAFGHSEFEAHIWREGDCYADAFRPNIEPDGFVTADALQVDRRRHLENVCRVFLESEWLIFTLGLTEAWVAKEDGAVFPLAPGVTAGAFDPQQHQFRNFSIAEVLTDLRAFISKAKEVNPRLRIILTVSPVPLVATYEKRHVLVSTAASKAILRTAADAMEREFDFVTYFPSYEIITSPANGGRYYADDLREVTDLGVDHVMRVFSRHFLGEDDGGYDMTLSRTMEVPSGAALDTVECDEEEILRSLVEAGFGPTR